MEKKSFFAVPENIKMTCDFVTALAYQTLAERKLWLSGEICGADDSEYASFGESMGVSDIVDAILCYNREDKDLPVEERTPVTLYINSPGGSVVEGFPLVEVIKLSKTPIYTVNIGQWSSMAFYIGITGHKRFSLPGMTFLLHDGFEAVIDSSSKAQDAMNFNSRFKKEITKAHVLGHSKMSEEKYDSLIRTEFYMLPEDALKYGFIDKIVDDLDEIL